MLKKPQMTIRNILTVGLFFLTGTLAGQNFKSKFSELCSEQDTAGQRQLLESWEKSNATDPELYVAQFNYYVQKSRQDMIEIGNNPKGDQVLVIEGQDTTVKEPVAYMYDGTFYEPTQLNKGFAAIDQGIEKNPSRLDMRFGKIYMLGEAEEYGRFTSEIVDCIHFSNTIDNKWLWSENEPVKDPKEFFLGSLQDYILRLYETGDDALLPNMERISNAVLKYHPDHVESLSNLSIVYMLTDQLDKALEVLLRASKIAPTDYIVLANVARAYMALDNKAKAIEYYELTVKHGDERTKEFARKQIEELKKK